MWERCGGRQYICFTCDEKEDLAKHRLLFRAHSEDLGVIVLCTDCIRLLNAAASRAWRSQWPPPKRRA